jgi:hypothetical protein
MLLDDSKVVRMPFNDGVPDLALCKRLLLSEWTTIKSIDCTRPPTVLAN